MKRGRVIRRHIPAETFAVVLVAGIVAQLGAADDRADLSAVHRIRTEAFDSSKVMEHLFFLSDVYGPRLTNSPGYNAAAAWAAKRMREFGVDARFENWGRFGRSWTYTHFEGHLVEPQYAPLIGFPLAGTEVLNHRTAGVAGQGSTPFRCR
jgi:carboxypeptidase Q